MAGRAIRFGLIPAVGIGKHIRECPRVIRLLLHGCANRPFYHIVVIERRMTRTHAPIEQLGTFDPMPNIENEKLVSFNFERLKYWIGHGAQVTTPVAQLLGLAGFFPIHPRTYMQGWRNRRSKSEANSKEKDNLEGA